MGGAGRPRKRLSGGVGWMFSISVRQGWLAIASALYATYHSVGVAPRDDWVAEGRISAG